MEFQLQHQSFNGYSGLISFRIYWLDLLAVQGTLKSLLQHHSSKASILQHSPFVLTGLISLQSKGLSRVFSNIVVQKHQFFGTQLSLWSNSHIHIPDFWKNHSFDYTDLVSKVMSLLFNMLSRLVIAFLPRNKHLLNFMAAVTIFSDSGAQENKVCHCFLFFHNLFAMK